jgi:adenylate cyclase
MERDGDLIGDGVNVASRIEPLAAPGGICVTGPVFDQIRNKIPEQVLLIGRPELKNIEIPIDVYGVALPWEDAPAPLPRPSGATGASPSRRVILAAFAALAILAVAFGLTSMNRGTSAPKSAVSPAVAPKGPAAPTIAVMPFANHSHDGADAYLADGLTEAVAISLSKISALQVIDRYSVYSDRGKTGEAREIKKSLMASHLLEGSVQKEGGDLAIRIHLANSTDGKIIWSENYQRKMGTILKMDQEVAEEVARGLKITLLPSDRERLSRTADTPEAYEFYLKGREQQLKFGPDTLTKGIQLYNAALKLSPHMLRRPSSGAEYAQGITE